ncbi:hypothetical protein [Erwinia psidii]|uniref:hypothetical protein n=1 Tax=Erwinia psidii TaxID=69224 RepID=UPI0013155453|nr:hypothetical protein [Erwinia psidii]
MSIYIITATPFLILALVMLALAVKRKKRVYLTLGLSFLLTAVINCLVSLAVRG